MIKIGMADGQTLVKLSPQEFTGLAEQSTSNYPDGSTISLAPLKAKLDLVDNNAPILTAAKEVALELASKVTSIGL
jgi:hypothetical protein